ncbi:MAG TPA: hypothetical protein VNO55_02100 [Polyangia bacterium]|nr:hypothetical protein [Polyangia bacterium]
MSNWPREIDASKFQLPKARYTAEIRQVPPIATVEMVKLKL